MHLPPPTALRFEHAAADGPVLGSGSATPRLSWRLPHAPEGYRQGSYEVEVRRGEAAPAVVRVDSAEQVLVRWPVEPLTSRERAEVRIRVRATGGGEDWSPWSEPGVVEAGLLSDQDWSARFVSPRRLGGLESPAPVLRGSIGLPSDTVRARLYVTAHGLYVPTLNGVRVGDAELAP